MNTIATNYLSNNYTTTTIRQKVNKSRSEEFFGTISSAASVIKEPSSDGKVLGLTMIQEKGTNVSWGMVATYAPESTDENPIVQVKTNYGGETSVYNVAVNDINPNQASELEMFALCAYADDKNPEFRSTFGTYHTLQVYETMAKHNGSAYINEKDYADSWKEFQDAKTNWINLCKEVMNLVYQCHDYSSYKNGQRVIETFSKCGKLTGQPDFNL
jgi:hypothetical protein